MYGLIIVFGAIIFYYIVRLHLNMKYNLRLPIFPERLSSKDKDTNNIIGVIVIIICIILSSLSTGIIISLLY